MTFKISPEGNRRKAIENEISVKVFLDVDTVNILYKYDLEDDIQNKPGIFFRKKLKTHLDFSETT